MVVFQYLETKMRSVSAMSSHSVGAPIILDLEDLTGDIIDRKIIGPASASPGTRLLD